MNQNFTINKFQAIKRNNCKMFTISNDNKHIISKNEINNDIFFDFKNEKQFIENKINKKYNKTKCITKSLIKTIKYEYKISNENNKNNHNINYNDKKANYSTLLRNHSNILNNKPLDSFFDKSRNTIDNNEINNNKIRKIKNKTKKVNKNSNTQSSINGRNKGFENFSLNKVCGSSHPSKEKNSRNDDYIKKSTIERLSNTNYEYKYIKSYILNYNYKENSNNLNNEYYNNNFNNNDKNNIIVNNRIDKNFNNNDKAVVNSNKNKILNDYNNFIFEDKAKQNLKDLNNKTNKKLFLPDSLEIKDSKKTINNQSIQNYNNITKLKSKTKQLKKSDKSYNYLTMNEHIINKNKYRTLEKENKSTNTIDINYELNRPKNFYIINKKKLNEKNQTLFNNKSRNIFSLKNLNYRKSRNTEKIRCVMPPNNLRNILLQNEVNFFNKTKLFL